MEGVLTACMQAIMHLPILIDIVYYVMLLLTGSSGTASISAQFMFSFFCIILEIDSDSLMLRQSGVKRVN